MWCYCLRLFGSLVLSPSSWFGHWSRSPGSLSTERGELFLDLASYLFGLVACFYFDWLLIFSPLQKHSLFLVNFNLLKWISTSFDLWDAWNVGFERFVTTETLEYVCIIWRTMVNVVYDMTLPVILIGMLQFSVYHFHVLSMFYFELGRGNPFTCKARNVALLCSGLPAVSSLHWFNFIARSEFFWVCACAVEVRSRKGSDE